MRKIIALFLALVMGLTMFACACADEPRTERVGLLKMLNQDEKEALSCIKAVIIIADIVAAQGYSENLLPNVSGSIDTAIRFEPEYFDTLDTLIAALQSGRVDITPLYSTVAAYVCANDDELVQTTVFKPLDENADMFVRLAYTGLLCNDFSFMMREGNEALRDEFNGAIAAIKQDGTLQKLVEEHIDAAIAGKDIARVEMPVFDGAEVIRVAVTGDLPPMDYTAADDTPAGFNTALLAEISRRIGKNIELVPANNLSRSVMLGNNQVDVVFWTRTNRESSRIAAMPEDEKESYMHNFLDVCTEEERTAVENGRKLIRFSDYGKWDMPDETIITEPYFSDMLVPVAKKTFVEAVSGAAGN